jgi:predicted nucleotidyltransferase component of viral defense system
VNEDGLKDIASSVHQRLLNRARQTDRPFNELLQYYAMERFLYRLSKSRYKDKFILKGALMLIYWEAPISRPTADIDLLGYLDSEVDTVVSIMKDICGQQVVPDGMIFHTESVSGERIIEGAEYQSVRVKARGGLGNAMVMAQIDVGFGDVVIPFPEKMTYPVILDFPAPRLLGYSRESTIAEKLATMIRLGILNSRMKDIFDIWLLSQRFAFVGEVLSRAIIECFIRRGVEAIAEPVALSSEFSDDPAKATQWRAFKRKSRLEGVSDDLADLISAIADFLTPILSAISEGKDFKGRWKPSGPWRQG